MEKALSWQFKYEISSKLVFSVNKRRIDCICNHMHSQTGVERIFDDFVISMRFNT